MNWRKVFSLTGLLVLLLAAGPLSVVAAPRSQDALSKVEPLVLQELAAQGQTDFFVWMTEQADVSYARQLQTKLEKGQYVFDTLVATADRTQKDLRGYLDRQGVDYRSFYIVNAVFVRGGDLTLLLNLAARTDVSHVTANHTITLDEPVVKNPDPGAPAAIEANITFIKAPQVWAMGYTGQGTVMAGNDTGLDETHPTIARHYRGCLNPPTWTAAGASFSPARTISTTLA